MAALLLLGCLICAAQAWRIGLADSYRYQVQRDIGRWQRAGEADLRQWRRALAYNRRSLRLDPDHPVYFHHAALLHEWRLLVVQAPLEQPAQRLAQALDYQRRVLRRRPSWPEAWVHLALLKARGGQLDAEFAQALRRSLVLGPWQPRVHTLLVDIGLMTWSSLPPALRPLVVEGFARRVALGRNIEPWIDYLSVQAQFTDLCRGAQRRLAASLASGVLLSGIQPVARQACERARALSARARRPSPI